MCSNPAVTTGVQLNTSLRGKPGAKVPGEFLEVCDGREGCDERSQ